MPAEHMNIARFVGENVAALNARGAGLLADAAAGQPMPEPFPFLAEIPAGCFAYTMPDDSAAPRIHAGDQVAIEPTKEVELGAAYLLRHAGGDQWLCRVTPVSEDLCRYLDAPGDCVDLVPLIPGRHLAGGTLSADHLASMIEGRVVGVLAG